MVLIYDDISAIRIKKEVSTCLLGCSIVLWFGLSVLHFFFHCFTFSPSPLFWPVCLCVGVRRESYWLSLSTIHSPHPSNCCLLLSSNHCQPYKRCKPVLPKWLQNNHQLEHITCFLTYMSYVLKVRPSGIFNPTPHHNATVAITHFDTHNIDHLSLFCCVHWIPAF